MRQDVESLIAKLHPLERKVLPYLSQYSTLHELVGVSGLQEVEVMRALQWLQNKALVIISEEIQEVVELDSNGKIYATQGLPEKQFLKALEHSSGPVPVSVIQKNSGLDQNEITVCIGLLKRRNLITIQKDENELVVTVTDQGRMFFHKETNEEKFLKSLETARDKKELSSVEQIVLEE